MTTGSRATVTLRVDFDDDHDRWRVVRALQPLGSDGAPVIAGPAGTATAELGFGVRLTADVLDPSSLVLLEVPGPWSVSPNGDLDDEEPVRFAGVLDSAEMTVVGDLLGSTAADALRTPEAETFEIELAPTARLAAAGRVAVIEELHRAPQRPVEGLWAAEAAMLLTRTSESLERRAAEVADDATRSLTLLPTTSLESVNAALGSLDSIVSALASLAEGDALRSVLDAIRRGRRLDTGDLMEPAPGTLAATTSGDPAESGETVEIPSFRGKLSGGENEPEAPVTVRVDLDPADAHDGLFAAPPHCEIKDGRAVVTVELTDAGSTLPAEFLARLRAACRDAATGRLIERRGLSLVGSSLTATLDVDEPVDSVVFEITSALRTVGRAKRTIQVQSAIAAGRAAANAERRAAAAVSTERRGELLGQAALRWRLAADRWAEAGVERQQRTAVERADACENDDSSLPLWAFDTERAALAVAYVIGETPIEGRSVDELRQLARLAGSVGAVAQAAELALATIERSADGDPPPSARDLDLGLWSACASGDVALTRRMSAVWERHVDPLFL